MAILDNLLQLSNAQAVTATAVSTNTIDLTTARDLGPGSDLYMVFNTDTTVTAAGAATVTFEVITSATADLASPTVICSTGPIPKADLTVVRPPISLCVSSSQLLAQPNGQRYLGARYTVGTGPLTEGKFTTYLTNSEVGQPKYYASGFTVA